MVKANHNPNWTYIPNHPYRILIIGGSGSDKTYVIELNKKATTRYLIKFIYTSKIHSNQSINCLLMQKKKKKRRNLHVKKSNNIHWLFTSKWWCLLKFRGLIVLIVFVDKIADMESNKKFKSYSHWIVFKRKKTQYFTCFHIIIWLQSA